DPADPPASRAPVSEPVREALTGLLPADVAPVDLNASTFAIPGSQKASVVLSVGVNAFAAAAVANGTSHGSPLEIVATAFDTGGRPKGLARQSLELSWPPSATSTQRFDALSRLDLPPGEYEVRVAVTGSARTASVFS